MFERKSKVAEDDLEEKQSYIGCQRKSKVTEDVREEKQRDRGCQRGKLK